MEEEVGEEVKEKVEKVVSGVAVVVSARHEDPACNNFAQQWPR